jgi:hypothetical protein
MRKIFLIISAAVILSAGIAAPQAAEVRPGDVIGYALHSDIVAYINGAPIRSFNIDGNTAVIVEDLACYGFSVSWCSVERLLQVNVDFMRLHWDGQRFSFRSEYPPYIPEPVDIDMIYTAAAPVLYTNIATVLYGEINQRRVPGFNIGDKTLVYMDDLADIFGGLYIWDENARTLKLDAAMPWHIWVENPNSREGVYEISEGVAFTLRKCPENDELIVADYSGGRYYFPAIEISHTQLRFGMALIEINRNIEWGPTADFFSVFLSCIVSHNGMARREDTPELREKLHTVFRVYINGELMGGVITSRQGTGIRWHEFSFDRLVGWEEIESIRVEFG